MVAATPLAPARDQNEDELAEQLTPEERAACEADPWLRGFVKTTVAWERRNPGAVERHAAARAHYGADFEREAADFEAGTHPSRSSG